MKIKTDWDFSSIYTGLDDEQLQRDIERYKELSSFMKEKYEGRIKSLSNGDFFELMELDEEIEMLANKIYLYPDNLTSLDTQNQDVKKFMENLDFIFTEEENKMLFVRQELKDLGHDRLIEIANSPVMEPFRNSLVKAADMIESVKSEETEFALNLKSTPLDGYRGLYDEFTGSFMFDIEIDGVKKRLTKSEIGTLREDPRRDIRILANRSFREVYERDESQIVLGNCYTNILRNYTSEIPIRGLDNVMSLRNRSEQLPDEVVNTLLSEVVNSYPLFQRFARLKSRFFDSGEEGVIEKVDLHAPLVDDSEDVNIPLEEGVEMFLDTMKEFDEHFYRQSKYLIENGFVDFLPKKGKRGGAYSYSVKGLESFVLMNYVGKLSDVATLAHELGHAVHGNLAQKQRAQVYHNPLSLSETASTFNEMILSEKLMNKMDDSQKLRFLDERLGDIFATIHRQVQYVEFEKRCHNSILDGKSLSYKDYNLIWAEEQGKMWGSAVKPDVSAENEVWWSVIPHIFRSPFYCYSYAFGSLLTFGLYGQYEEEGESFVPKYKELLASGGSLAPVDLTANVGLDITKPEFYQTGLKVVESMVDEYERLSQ